VRRLRVTVVDLVTKSPSTSSWQRVMSANFASIMPQVVATWCEELGHEVRFVCYTGCEDLRKETAGETDILFLGAFTHAAQLAYAIAALFRARGTVTVLGGPHARAYPEDACKYFDYVLGMTDKAIVDEVLREAAPHRPMGRRLAANRQPRQLPGVRERWKFIEPTIAKAPWIKIVPMISSLGCPYTCSFCIDSTVDFQPLDANQMRDDLRFLLGKMRRPIVGWHDPNFGMRFEETMAAIEEAVPPGRIDFAAESSLSLLTEKRLERLRRNGFKAILPGIESWFTCGDKSKTGRAVGWEKMKRVSEHVNMVLRYIPYVQTNFVPGLDEDEGAEPFELTKRFIDLTPGAFPAFSLLSSFGRSAPLDLELQKADRVLPVPFHFLNNNRATNVRPKNYTLDELYDRVIDLRRHSFAWRAIGHRLRANRGLTVRGLNLVRAISSEGFGRIHYDVALRRLLRSDGSVRGFLEGETRVLPSFFRDQVRRDLGHLWDWLPAGALSHDENAYREEQRAAATPLYRLAPAVS
jgi:hypothetical protein